MSVSSAPRSPLGLTASEQVMLERLASVDPRTLASWDLAELRTLAGKALLYDRRAGYTLLTPDQRATYRGIVDGYDRECARRRAKAIAKRTPRPPARSVQAARPVSRRIGRMIRFVRPLARARGPRARSTARRTPARSPGRQEPEPDPDPSSPAELEAAAA